MENIVKRAVEEYMAKRESISTKMENGGSSTSSFSKSDNQKKPKRQEGRLSGLPNRIRKKGIDKNPATKPTKRVLVFYI